MTISLSTFLTVVAPMLTVGLTFGIWLVLVAIQTPKNYWRDTLNISISGMFLMIAVYFPFRAIVRAGVIPDGEIYSRIVLVLAGTFALVGLPKSVAQLRDAINSRRRRHARGFE